jgi:hypothetical protein
VGRYDNPMPEPGVDFIPQSGIYEFGYWTKYTPTTFLRQATLALTGRKNFFAI